jgi:hypothetical protein
MSYTKPLADIIPISHKNEYEPVFDSKGNKIANLSKNKSTGVIYLRKKFKKLGIPNLQCSTEEKVLSKAKTKATLLIQKHINKHLGVDDSHVFGRRLTKTFRDIGKWVLENHTPGQRKGTQNNHNTYILELIKILGDRDINSINSDSLKEVVEAVKQKKRISKNGKPLPMRQTFMDYAKNLNLVMKHAYQNKWTTHHLKFSNPDKKKETGRLLTRVEVNALWSAMNEDTRDQYVLALECVMRLREAICAPWSEINLETGEWTLPKERVKTGSKTGRGRSFIVSQNSLERLKARYWRRVIITAWDKRNKNKGG